jgi:hypothetical protein
MKELKNDIVREAHIYADEINDKLKKQMLDIQSTRIGKSKPHA